MIFKLPSTTRPLMLFLGSLGTIAMVITLEVLGQLEPLELFAYDVMVRLRGGSEPDPRLLLLEINEEDIQAIGQWPLSDALLADTLQTLQTFQPRAIGVDLVRDIPYPPGQERLLAELREPNVVSIAGMGNSPRERIPPPAVRPNQVGIADLPLDRDTAVRRAFLFASDGTTTYFSFGLRLALLYLQPQGITTEVTADQTVLLGGTPLVKLPRFGGGYHRLPDAAYPILLDFHSADAVARRITLQQLLQATETINPDWVQDKIVLIGAEAPSVKDLFITPYSQTLQGQRKMSGVEIHAQLVSQLLNVVLENRTGQGIFQVWPHSAEMIWVVVWAIAGSLFWGVIELHRLRSLMIIGLLLLIAPSIIAYTLFLNKLWIPIIAPTAAFIFASVIILSDRTQQLSLQQQMVFSLLGQQTSPDISQSLWQARNQLVENGRLPCQDLMATILFTDLKGFSTLSEGLSSNAVMNLLNTYLGTMTEAVLEHKGIVNKFTGDGLLAAFGVPVPRTTQAEIAEDATHAVDCALNMAERLATLNQHLQSQNLAPLQMRVGIFTGTVTVGSLGCKERLEYGIIGDTVNIASRLESCKPDRQPTDCRILIAQETWQHLASDRYPIERWGPVLLKGRQTPVEVIHIQAL